MSPRALLATALLAGVLAASPLGCRAIAGIETRGETCGGGLAAGKCGVCQSELCCVYALGCASTPDCASFRACREACSPDDELCASRCANDHPEGASKEADLVDCSTRSCSDRCGAWACVGEVVWPVAPTRVTITIRLRDSLDDHALEGLSVAACSFADPLCSEEAARTDANGSAQIDLPTPRDAFLRVWGTEHRMQDAAAGADGGEAASKAGTYPALIFFSPPPSVEGTFVRQTILSLGTAIQLGTALGSIDFETAGAILVTARNCDRVPAIGVSFGLEPRAPGTTSFYVRGSIPNGLLEETTDLGVGGFGNVPQGIVTIAARSNVAERQIGSRQVFVRAGHITYLEMPPMPAQFP